MINATPVLVRPTLLVLVRPAHQRYAIRRDDISDIRRFAHLEDIGQLGTSERPAVTVKLGEFLGEPSDLPARQGLIVLLRRRPIVFLIHEVESLVEVPRVEPLPELLRTMLGDAWSIGALHVDDTPTVILDLRAIARSVLAAAKTIRED